MRFCVFPPKSECIRTRESLNFRGPHGGSATAADRLVMGKAIDQLPFSAGTLILRPLEEKGTQYAGKDAMVGGLALIIIQCRFDCSWKLHI